MQSQLYMTSRQRKIDPMGVMGKIFGTLGAVFFVIGILAPLVLGLSLKSHSIPYFLVVFAGLWAPGLVFLILGLLFLTLFRNAKSANVVENYLAALANQDFSTAFSYLDPSMLGSSAPAEFAQRAETMNQRGTISRYGLRGFRINGPWAAYTIKVWRGMDSYIMRLFLTKRDGTWKITGFNSF